GVASRVLVMVAFVLLVVASRTGAAVGGAALGQRFQLGASAIPAGAVLGVVRPLAARHIRQPALLRSGTAALVGRSATVLEQVTAHGGQVRIGGELWSARSYDESQGIPVGSTVDVFAIEGATAPVPPRE